MQTENRAAVKFRNRETGELREEKIFSESLFRWLFESPVGHRLYRDHLSKKWFSAIYGIWHSLPWSKRKISRFIVDYGIDENDFVAGPYPNFNAFFVRRFKEDRRPFPTTPGDLGSPAEGRLLAFADIGQSRAAPIKGIRCDLHELLRKSANRDRFVHGPALIIRLAPTDYHRFHLPDNARVVETVWDGRRLYSVHPLSLRVQDGVFIRNLRCIRIFETENFGWLAVVAVGAFCVGSIRMLDGRLRGDEIGYFELGGSTIILLGERGRWVPDPDLLASTDQGVETFIRVGEAVAKALGRRED